MQLMNRLGQISQELGRLIKQGQGTFLDGAEADRLGDEITETINQLLRCVPRDIGEVSVLIFAVLYCLFAARHRGNQEERAALYQDQAALLLARNLVEGLMRTTRVGPNFGADDAAIARCFAYPDSGDFPDELLPRVVTPTIN